MKPAIDLAARRAAREPDAGELVRRMGETAESFLATVSSWPLIPLRDTDLVGAERFLVSLQVSLSGLRRFVPPTGAA